MNTTKYRSRLLLGGIALLLSTSAALIGQEINWEAFNDYRPGGDTHPNVTDYDLRITDDGGVLRDFATGDDLEAEVFVVNDGGDPDNFGALSPPFEDTPSDMLFGGKVDMIEEGLPGLRSSNAVLLKLQFQNLDPNARYNFRGTVTRGGNYDDRWSKFRISSTDAHVPAHVDGSDNQNLITKENYPEAELEDDEVALNTGDNKVGSLIGWDNIEPGDDGEFVIEAEQYQGPTPFGNALAGPYGYGFNAIYLAEIESSGDLRITENPPATQVVPAGDTVTLSVEATSPEDIFYQWQKSEPGEEDFIDIAGATGPTYTTPALTVADNGFVYRCVLNSDDNVATSGEAIIEVDGEIPTIAGVQGSVNFNAVYVTFSEPMKLALLGEMDSYSIEGLEIDSITVIDSSNVRLGTSSQPQATSYMLTVSEQEDLAGNSLAANSTVEFTSFALTNGVVGLEIWRNIPGGAVDNLLDDPDYPDFPDIDYSVAGMDSLLVFEDGPNNTYGGRFRGWLIPQETAQYEFFLRADDNGTFNISSNDQFGELDNPNRIPDLAAGGNNPFEIPSEPFSLEAGTKYAVQVIWKEGNINDRAQLAWRKVGDDLPEEPIPGEFFCYYGPDAPDEDNDGMSDIYEELNGLNTAVNDAAGDLDGDGISNKEEHDRGLAANREDTDGDGIVDGAETNTGTYVSATDTGTDPANSDTDRDGVVDGAETLTGVYVSPTDTGTDPHDPDTDDDGARDGLEVLAGFDPNNPGSVPTVMIGGGVFTTTHVWTDGDPTMTDVIIAEETILDEDAGLERITVETEFIHFHDNVDPPIFVDQSRPYPLWDEENGGDGFGDRNHFAIRSVGQINLTLDGTYSFICNSDDGFQLRIDGDIVGEVGDRGRGNTLMEVDLDAGIHDIEFIHYENAGGAGVSLYIYRSIGASGDLSEEEWELVRAFGGGSKPFQMTDIDFDGDTISVTWTSNPGETFIVEQSTDLDLWIELTDGWESQGSLTTFDLELDDPRPDTLYLRARRE